MAEQNQPTNDQVAAEKLREAAQRQAQAAKDTEFAAENAPGLNPEAADEQKGGKQHNNKEHANQYTQGRNDDRGRKE